MRRYFAAYSQLGDFIIEEAGEASLRRSELKELLQVQATQFDRVVAAVSDEYVQERSSRPTGSKKRRADSVARLLAGEPVDLSRFPYHFDCQHVGIVAVGPQSSELLRWLANSTDSGLLLIEREEGAVWAWLGKQGEIDSDGLMERLPLDAYDRLTLAIGEPADGVEGWRLTHRQAVAAFPIARRSPRTCLRYADVSLLASAYQDDLLMRSMQQLFVSPFDGQRDGGRTLRDTISAYLSAECNLSSAASALGVSRQTVGKRLRMAEELLGRPINTCSTELAVALQIGQIDNRRDSTAPM